MKCSNKKPDISYFFGRRIPNFIQIDRSPAFLIADDFIRSNKIVKTNWPNYQVIGHFILTI